MKKPGKFVDPWSIVVAPHLSMRDFTRVLVTNVTLATTVLVLVFHAPVAFAGLGAVAAGLLIWGMRRVHARRTR